MPCCAAAGERWVGGIPDILPCPTDTRPVTTPVKQVQQRPACVRRLPPATVGRTMGGMTCAPTDGLVRS